MGSSSSKRYELTPNPLYETHPPALDARMEMQRCMMTQKVLVSGSKTSQIQELLATIRPDPNFDEKLMSFFHHGVLDLRVTTTVLSMEDLIQGVESGTFDHSEFDGLLLVWSSEDTPSLADVQQLTKVVSQIAQGKEKLYRGVCYLVPEGGAESEQGGEAGLLEARWTQVKITDIKGGASKYDTVLEDLFHDVLHDTYSKRPTHPKAANNSKSVPKAPILPPAASSSTTGDADASSDDDEPAPRRRRMVKKKKRDEPKEK